MAKQKSKQKEPDYNEVNKKIAARLEKYNKQKNTQK
jgi:hypothetical protein